MWRRWAYLRQFKLNLIRLLRLKDSPEQIARGMALGLFVGMTPTFGIQMGLVLFFAIFLRENKLSALLGVWVTNPLSAPFIYGLEYELGRHLLGLPLASIKLHFNYQFLQHLGWQVLLPLCLGSLIFALLAAFLGYFVTLKVVPVLRRWRIPRWPRRHNGNDNEE